MHNSKQHFRYVHKMHVFTWLCILMGILMTTVARCLLYSSYGSPNLLNLHLPDILHSFKIGLLFDLKTMASLFGLFLFIGVTGLCWRTPQPLAISLAIYRRLSIALLSFCLLLIIINHYFYGMFHAHINVLIFALFDGQTDAILQSVWTDFPFIRLLIGWLIGCFVIRYLVNRSFAYATDRRYSPGLMMRIIYISGMAIIFGILFRGSVNSEKLKVASTLFTNNNLINQATLNGPAAFFYAIQDRYNDVKLKPVSRQDGQVAYQTYFERKAPPHFSLQTLFTKTPKQRILEKKPPNVVFVQMESMGSHFLSLDNQKHALLGKLAPHWQQDTVFTHFLSAGENTIDAIAHFLVSSPFMYVSQSSLRNVSYQSSVARPFKQAGYTTVFLSAGEAGWHNLADFLPRQQFDKVYGKQAILKAFPKAETEAWGVYDEYVFKYAENLLKQAKRTHKPIFIYLYTISNHTPYTLPSAYKPAHYVASKTLAKRVQVSQKRLRQLFATFQYANDCLGEFLTKIKTSALGNNTIVAATGDHNQHDLIAFYDNYADRVYQHSVPLYFYIPDAYKPKHSIDTSRIGSHKDVFPTLYHLALSNARYLNLGNNLFANSIPFQFAYYKDTYMLSDGLIVLGQPDLFYPWQDKKKFTVGEGVPLNPTQQKIAQRINAYDELLHWQLLRQATLATNNKSQ